MLDENTKNLIDEKLGRIAELVQIRNDAYDELLDILNAPKSNDVELVHVKKRAPKETRSWTPKQKGAKRKEGTRGTKCEECGTKGWRHYTTCSKNGAYTKKVIGEAPSEQSHGKTILDEPDKLTRTDWVEIKEQFNDGVGSDMLKISYPEYSPMEIRAAVKFDSYDEYEKST